MKTKILRWTYVFILAVVFLTFAFLMQPWKTNCFL